MPIKVGDLPIGAEITIQVDNKPWVCTKVHQGYWYYNNNGYGKDGAVFVMKCSPLLMSQWTTRDDMGYGKSEVNRILNDDFLHRIEPRIRNAIPYPRQCTVAVIKRQSSFSSVLASFVIDAQYQDSKLFLLSGRELGVSDADTWIRCAGERWFVWPRDETDSSRPTLAGFISGRSPEANARRREILGITDDGVPGKMAVWTRSPIGSWWGCAGFIMTDGSYGPQVEPDPNDSKQDISGYYGSVGIRVGLNPAFCLPPDFTIPNNTAQITDEDRNLGTFTTTAPSASYTITDPGNFAQTVTEKLNGTVLRTYNAVLGREETATIPADKWLETLNGDYTLTITATDVDGMEVVRTFTFKKAMNTLEFSTKEAIQADEMPIKAILNVQGAMPQGSIFKAEICNNGNDAAPAWEDVTESVKSGEKFFFKNKIKTAEKWGVKVRISLQRGTATGPCYIQSVGGNFD